MALSDEQTAALARIRAAGREIMPRHFYKAKKTVNGETSYICPFPDCGHGKNGDGLAFDPTSKDGNTLHCFSCNFSGDIIDLWQKYYQLDFNHAAAELSAEIGLDPTIFLSNGQNRADKEKNKPTGGPLSNESDQGNIKARSEKKALKNDSTAKPKRDFTEYYKQCRKNYLDNQAAKDYVSGRGVSESVAEKFMVGYDPTADPAKNPGGQGVSQFPAARIIIPVTKEFYLSWALDPNNPYRKLNSAGAKIATLNHKALKKENDLIFITEGAWDCLSIETAGYTAVSINSTSNAESFCKLLEKANSNATYILCLDNDEQGVKAQEIIKSGLQANNKSYIMANLNGGYGDINDYWQKDTAGATDTIEKVIEQTAPRPDNISYYIDSYMAADIESGKQVFKTGFEKLDDKLGGIHAGLITLAGLPSLGKSSLALQIADNIAAAGNHVLYFSMEMSRLELVAKSVSRTMAADDLNAKYNATTILKGYLPETILAAADKYKNSVGENLSIIENNCCDISFIGDYIRRYIKKNACRPFVVLDYLQLILPEQGLHGSTKEMIDHTTSEIKRLSRAEKIPILAISSTNRQSYTETINFASLKESGILEFSSDICLGLELTAVESPEMESATTQQAKREIIDKAKGEIPRKITLKILKNRFGVANANIDFWYYSNHDLFKELD